MPEKYLQTKRNEVASLEQSRAEQSRAEQSRAEQSRAEQSRVFCLFEQSGTFKKEFRNLGIEAYDYDILNDYGETDCQIDLFHEIEMAYEEKESIFDNFKSDDLLMAFFPCIRFENQIMLSYRGQMHGMEDWTYKQKMQNCMKLLSETKHNYDLVNKLFIVCMDRNLRLIMENPYSEEHFLRRYWCFPATIIDRDRRKRGDYMKKPTQYWFLNIEPKNNLVLEPMDMANIQMNIKDMVRSMNKKVATDLKAKTNKQARSMISDKYANVFIREFVLNSDGTL